MKIIIGLCNYDNKLMNTKHNAGKIVTEKFITNKKIENHNFIIFNSNIENTFVVFIKNYINLSGIYIKEIIENYNVKRINVFFDDVDISLGKFKIQRGMCNSKHNGIKSILYNCNLFINKFSFFKIGVRCKDEIMLGNLRNYVLKEINNHEIKILEALGKSMCENWIFFEKNQDNIFYKKIYKDLEIFNA